MSFVEVLAHLLKSYHEQSRAQSWQVTPRTFCSRSNDLCSEQSSTSASHLPNKRCLSQNFRKVCGLLLQKPRMSIALRYRTVLLTERTHKREKNELIVSLCSLRHNEPKYNLLQDGYLRHCHPIFDFPS